MSKKKKHHRYDSGSEDDSISSDSDSSDQRSSSEDRRKRKRRKSHTRENKEKRKEKRAKSKHKKLKESHKKKKHKEKKKKTHSSVTSHPDTIDSSTFGPQLPLMINPPDPTIPVLIEPVKRSLAPMTKEEYDKQQSILRRVLDPETGRHRLVKGDGEIVEEIVSRERHAAINKIATLHDGYSFQAGLRKF